MCKMLPAQTIKFSLPLVISFSDFERQTAYPWYSSDESMSRNSDVKQMMSNDQLFEFLLHQHLEKKLCYFNYEYHHLSIMINVIQPLSLSCLLEEIPFSFLISCQQKARLFKPSKLIFLSSENVKRCHCPSRLDDVQHHRSCFGCEQLST